MKEREESLTYKGVTRLNVNRIVKKTEAEGPGIRLCIWMQGCRRRCPGCFAKETWSFEENKLYAPGEVIAMADTDTEGITVLGGEPFEQKEALLELVKEAARAGLSVIIFTGYKYEEVMTMGSEILQYTDVLIDGEYVQEQRSFDRPLVGSENQNFIFLSDRYNMYSFPPNRIEVRIGKDGSALFNGMGDFEVLRKKMGKKDGI